MRPGVIGGVGIESLFQGSCCEPQRTVAQGNFQGLEIAGLDGPRT